jgi:cytochrome c oxidase subunit I
MFGSVVLFVIVMGMTIFACRRTERGDVPFAETIIGPARTGWETKLDHFGIWVAVTVVLILIAYGPFMVSYLPPKPLSPGFKLF